MTEDRYGIEMGDEEIAAFLTRQGHGVLSFGGEFPYGFPISFGYDIMEHRCILQLLFGKGSHKREHLDESNKVNLVSYEWDDPDDWRSVVLDGTLHPIEDEPETLEAAEVFAEYASVAGLTVFNEPVTELDPEWFELRIDSWSGYRSPLVADDSLD